MAIPATSMQPAIDETFKERSEEIDETFKEASEEIDSVAKSATMKHSAPSRMAQRRTFMAQRRKEANKLKENLLPVVENIFGPQETSFTEAAVLDMALAKIGAQDSQKVINNL